MTQEKESIIDKTIKINHQMFINNRNYYVYILASKRNGVLYVGVTNNLFRRILQHKTKFNKNSFSARYNVDNLVYYEWYQSILSAIRREKCIKAWKRKWKVELIEKDNPDWIDLFDGFQLSLE